MIRHFIPLLAFAPLLASADIVASGHIVEQVRPVAEFSAIRAEGALALDVTAGTAQSVRVVADDNLQPLIETSVANGELTIRFKPHHETISFGDGSRLHVNVTVPKLVRFDGNSAGKSVFHNLSGERFALVNNGAGLVTASGAVKELTVGANGAGSIDLRALKATNAAVSVNGLVAANVFASGSLKAEVNGVGSITYFGHPASLTKSVSGIGSVSAGD